MPTGFTIAFLLLAATAIAAAWKMIFSHHPIHSALYLVLNLCASAGIYLLLSAPFIAVVQITVYAGAIVVLFLFIIMYLNLGLAPDRQDEPGRRGTAIAVAVILGLMLLGGGALPWAGLVAGTTETEIQSAQEALEAGRDGLPGKPAGTPEAEQLKQVARSLAGGEPASVEDIGVTLFSRYLLPFEIASVLLLVAMIGALVIARPEIRREAERKEATE